MVYTGKAGLSLAESLPPRSSPVSLGLPGRSAGRVSRGGRASERDLEKGNAEEGNLVNLALSEEQKGI